MTFIQSIQTVLTKSFDYSGRATRSEFWWWVLFTFAVNISMAAFSSALLFPNPGSALQNTISWIVSLFLFVPSISVAARRLHDIRRSGWWQLVGFIPIIGWVIVIFWYVQPGTVGKNRFG